MLVHFSSYFCPDPETLSSGSAFRPPGRCRPMTQYVAAESAAYDAICCVTPPPRDCPLTL